MSARTWTCPSCTFENDADQNPTRCDVCKHKRYSDNNIRSKPNMSAMRRAASREIREQPYRLAPVPSNQSNESTQCTLFGISIVSHVKLLLSSFYGYVFLRALLLPIWLTFFPHISVMKVVGYILCIAMTWIVLIILLFLKRQYEKHNDPIPWTRLPFTLPIILMVFAASHGFQWQFIMENARKIADHDFWIEHLKVAVVELEYGMQAMDERITKQIDVLNASYSARLEETESVQKVEELASKMWEGFGLISITRKHFGLGCFVEGTLIQSDAFGNIVTVETLNRTGSTVFNQALNQTIRVKVFTYDPEYEDVFEIESEGGHRVTVTKSHPMMTCMLKDCYMIRADALKVGDSVLTIDGVVEVKEVVKRPGEGVMVYNVMLDLEQDVPVWDRVIVANGFVTGDLMVQATME